MASAAEDDSAPTALPDCGDVIDESTFEQILEMDDDDKEREFSRELVFGFFEQSAQTFKQMDAALKEKNLSELSALGHYLKGSSATLGLTKVRDHCEKIQNLGSKKTAAGDDVSWDESEYLKEIGQIIPFLKVECEFAEERLRAFYSRLRGA